MKGFLLFVAILFGTAAHSAVREASVLRAGTASRAGTEARQVRAPVRGVVSRAAAPVPVRSRAAAPGRSGVISARTASTLPARQSRAAVSQPRSAVTARSAALTGSLGQGYEACRDSYFTCMDQFCAARDETYRRCACSSRLDEIRATERALNQTSDQLQDFKDTNINAISKTGAEVNAMFSATVGENAQANAKDESGSAAALAGISAVLSGTRNKALSNAGQLDIAGDINSIWATANLTAGADIMTLMGERLYNAVHGQCVEFASANCPSKSSLDMAVSAYGMYIENDCQTLASALGKNVVAAEGAIRQTEREMNVARLENYDTHNSASINECLVKVRGDITGNLACGTDFSRCLDLSGRFLNVTTGEPIYSTDFFKFEKMLSLDGDVLRNQTNKFLIDELNHKKEFAKQSLDTCRDVSEEVWNEFLRQALAEIYQAQQAKVREVKDSCIDVVNQCMDEKTGQLRDFSDTKKPQQLLAARLELSEQMCREKLDTCSNLFGGGPSGMPQLIEFATSTTDQKIVKDCKTSLETYAKEICSPRPGDKYKYPFACRVYSPGDRIYASRPMCNIGGDGIEWLENALKPVMETIPGYSCPAIKRKYTSCNDNFVMMYNDKYARSTQDLEELKQFGNQCVKCPSHYICSGSVMRDSGIMDQSNVCSTDYTNSLYRKLVMYAMQSCARTEVVTTGVLPVYVLEDVSRVMDQIMIDMTAALSEECAQLGGVWDSVPGNKAQMSCGPEQWESGMSGCVRWGPFDDLGSSLGWGQCLGK